MRIPVLTMALLVFQASSPVPRQAANNATGSGNHIHQDAPAQQQPAALPAVKQAVKTDPDKNGAQKPPAADAPKTVIIGEPISVSVETDWWNRLSVIFTGILVVIGALGARAAVNTLRALKRDYTATHRPKLRVRKFMVRTGTQLNRAAVELANVGDTSALITASHCQFIVRSTLAEAIADFKDDPPNNPFPKIEIGGGEFIGNISLPADEEIQSVVTLANTLLGSGSIAVLWAIGWVEYRDGNGTIRRTGFCRGRDPESGLFVAGPNPSPDYEYED